MDVTGPRVRDDMTVEVALSVMAGARVEYLLLCDGDDQCTGVITRSGLAALRSGSAYTDRLRLRDVPHGPLSSSGARSGGSAPAGPVGPSPSPCEATCAV
ncbi:CBS domain-containing protein [Streptomyces sp. NPDC052020]|uniref:CBS domain-containing protein n=1 Tax=Streptomyces sp. NPDC052020 TaxID=3155677 RepID=UPI003444F706